MKIIKPITITDAMLTSNVAGSGIAAWVSTTSYSVGQQILDAASHCIYQSVINSNVGNNPTLGDTTKWVNIGAENKWRMFDQSISSQTSNASSIVVTIAPSQIVNSVAILNTSCSTIRIRVIDPVDGVVYDVTNKMVSTTGINTWAAWYRQPLVSKSYNISLNLPSYALASIEVTFSVTSGNAACGVLVVGQQIELGDTEYGSSVSFDDYSIKKRDVFGGWTIVQRDYSQRGKFNVFIENNQIDGVFNSFVTNRATPMIFIGSELYNPMIIYGYLKSFELIVAYSVASTYALDVEGLT